VERPSEGHCHPQRSLRVGELLTLEAQASRRRRATASLIEPVEIIPKELSDPHALDQKLVTEILAAARMICLDQADELRGNVDEQVATLRMHAGVLPMPKDFDRHRALPISRGRLRHAQALPGATAQRRRCSRPSDINQVLVNRHAPLRLAKRLGAHLFRWFAASA
jgi:hypothetical protein